jgi:hypothetical protein
LGWAAYLRNVSLSPWELEQAAPEANCFAICEKKIAPAIAADHVLYGL